MIRNCQSVWPAGACAGQSNYRSNRNSRTHNQSNPNQEGPRASLLRRSNYRACRPGCCHPDTFFVGSDRRANRWVAALLWRLSGLLIRIGWLTRALTGLAPGILRHRLRRRCHSGLLRRSGLLRKRRRP